MSEGECVQRTVWAVVVSLTSTTALLLIFAAKGPDTEIFELGALVLISPEQKEVISHRQPKEHFFNILESSEEDEKAFEAMAEIDKFEESLKQRKL